MQINAKTKPVILGLSVLTFCVFAGYIALGIGTSTMDYPVEDFSHDAAYPVLRVIDGDTVQIQYNNKPTTVRLLGVDTPETVHPQKVEIGSVDCITVLIEQRPERRVS